MLLTGGGQGKVDCFGRKPKDGPGSIGDPADDFFGGAGRAEIDGVQLFDLHGVSSFLLFCSGGRPPSGADAPVLFRVSGGGRGEMTQTRLRDCYGHYNTKSRDSLSARRFRTAPRAGSLNPRGVSQGLRRRKDLFPLQGVLQKPDIGDSFEPADHPSGGGPVACAVVPGKGKVENQQVPGPDLPLQKLPSFSQRYPRKIQKREIDGGISDELCKQRLATSQSPAISAVKPPASMTHP